MAFFSLEFHLVCRPAFEREQSQAGQAALMWLMEAVWSAGKVLARISKGDGFQPPFCLGFLQLWPIVVRWRLGAARGALAGCRSWAVTEPQQAAWGCPSLLGAWLLSPPSVV